jgi:hypothetical protein
VTIFKAKTQLIDFYRHNLLLRFRNKRTARDVKDLYDSWNTEKEKILESLNQRPELFVGKRGDARFKEWNDEVKTVEKLVDDLANKISETPISRSIPT